MPVLFCNAASLHIKLLAVLVLASKHFSVSGALSRLVYTHKQQPLLNSVQTQRFMICSADSLLSKYVSGLIGPSSSTQGLQCRLDGTSSLLADMIQEHSLAVRYSRFRLDCSSRSLW